MESTIFKNEAVSPYSKDQSDTLFIVGNSSDISVLIATKPSYLLPYQCVFTHRTEDVLAHISAYDAAAASMRMAILMDARWAEHNRFQLLKQLRECAAYQHVPILVISDRMHMTAAENFLNAGADDYFNRPVEPDRLETLLDYLWANKPEIVALSPALQRKMAHQPHQPVFKARHLKRAIDISGALFGMVVLSPVMLATALAIRLESKGPIFYCSKRVGAGFKTFNFWKFRSMYTDADQRLQEIARKNNQYGDNATFVKIANDPRVTRVGKIIRKYSIDELPQLYNVLTGDMSLVGNRPLPVYEADRLFEEESGGRFLAPAGLTGLWQVSKRGAPDMSTTERIDLDIKYAKNQSLINDIKILLRTFTAFIQKENV
jgi:lipopolysaccharide/colanic/teichoic acid biosynthesis glycosyltransferase